LTPAKWSASKVFACLLTILAPHMESLSILVLEDSNKGKGVGKYLRELKNPFHRARSAGEVHLILKREAIHLAIIDISTGMPDGIQLISSIKESYPFLPIVAVASEWDTETLMSTIHAGASDYLLKPFTLAQLKKALERNRPPGGESTNMPPVKLSYKLIYPSLKKANIEVVGNSPSMKKLFKLVANVARSKNTTVLLTGESGTGKDLIARCIHELSSRNKNAFHRVNCSAIPDALFDSEFFGQGKEVVSGSVENIPGGFEASGNSTLMLDEVGELPRHLQVKLLRVLDNKTLHFIGNKKTTDLNFRIIAATNQDLKRKVAEKKFRDDLYHRLNSFEIHIPALRDRKEDIPELINYYIKQESEKLHKKIVRIDERIYKKLHDYHFPGNVRELKNIIERAIIVCDGDSLRLKHIQLPEAINYNISEQVPVKLGYDLQEVKKHVIMVALRHARFNKSKAAQLLNISRQAVDRSMEKYHLQ
jgi:DNA-binding NtrC family response regulator